MMSMSSNKHEEANELDVTELVKILKVQHACRSYHQLVCLQLTEANRDLVTFSKETASQHGPC